MLTDAPTSSNSVVGGWQLVRRLIVIHSPVHLLPAAKNDPDRSIEGSGAFDGVTGI
jgi:hypothetical protein